MPGGVPDGGFADHFSAQARTYASARPTYPDGLFDWLASLVPDAAATVAWDCATGNGQAAAPLAQRFGLVVATEPSLAQLAHRVAHDRVAYVAATAEQLPLAGGRVGLVTVAQAMHWFDLDRFHAEVRRVLRPDGVIAAWSYGSAAAGEDVEPLLRAFEHEELGPYWPPERVHVDAGYRTLAFPFATITAPTFVMQHDWSLDQLLAYHRSWSAVAAFVRRHGRDPVDGLAARLRPLWQDGERRMVTWPLAVLAGRVRGS